MNSILLFILLITLDCGHFIILINMNIDNTGNMNLQTRLKFIQYNCNNKSNLTPDIGPCISNTKQNILMTLNETFALPDLSIYRLAGIRHSNPMSRGLCLFISDHLRHYTDVFYSAYTINGLITLPSNNMDKEAMTIAFIATYRSPSLDPQQEEEFFDDLNKVCCELLEKSPLVYLMGDLNVFKNRYYKDDINKIANTPQCKNSRAYFKFMQALPGPTHHYISEPTHFPHQSSTATCAQLDYLLVLYAGETYPSGKSSTWITTSDHRALICQINVPYLANVKIRFSNHIRYINTDFKFLDFLIYSEASKLKWHPEVTWDNLTRLEILKDHLIQAHSLEVKQNKPSGTSNFESKIKILQNKAMIARKKGDWANYTTLISDIKEAITRKATTALNDCDQDQDKASGLFYKWAGSILKPCKAEQGKYTMTNKSVHEVTSPINENYIDNNPIIPDFRASSDEEKSKLIRACQKFNFKKVLGKIKKVPPWFKQIKNTIVYLAERLTLAVILGENYPPCLKLCQADILPSRSIFQMLNPFSKLVESFFADQLQSLLSDCQNFAYRPLLSCTSLMMLQFDYIARKPLLYGFNGDLKKAFDRLSRKLVYDRIQNSALANIIWSWLDRRSSPYFLWWRGEYNCVSRDDFNRGCPPGSICGPVTYILGQSDHLNFTKALFKALFADDSLPLTEDPNDMIEDAENFANFAHNNGMSLHTEGDKAAVFMVFGKGAVVEPLQEISLLTDFGRVDVKRTWKIRQLGFDVAAHQANGRALVMLDRLIDKLKHASIAMRVLSAGTLSSTMISLVRTYLISLVSYGIICWYPLMSVYDPAQIKAVRYWYYSVICYICSDTKQLLSWSISSHTMALGHSCEIRFKELCGLPTLEELCIASAKAHYQQIRQMLKLGWLDRIVYETARDKLVYLCVPQIQKKFISPLRVCIDILDKFGCDKLFFDTKDSWLVKLEVEDLLKDISKEEIRLFQRSMTIMHFQIEKEYFKRVKKGDKIRQFFEQKEKVVRKLLKRYRRFSTKNILRL